MLRMLPFVALLILAVFCLVEAISSRPDGVRNLPKWAWIVLILLFPLLGSIAWLLAGRPARGATARPTSTFPGYERPARSTATNPEDDEEFLRTIRERAEEQRRKHAEEKKREQEKPDES